MENYGLIIKHLRGLLGLSVRQTAERIKRSVGWLSEIENNTGRSRLSEKEFDRIVGLLDGTQHKAMFRTWVATYKNSERTDKVFDGAVLKYIRVKQKLRLSDASKLTGISVSQLSKFESGLKTLTLTTRSQIMKAYGYQPSSFKNLSTDPLRSKVVPPLYKLKISLRDLTADQIDKLRDYIVVITE